MGYTKLVTYTTREKRIAEKEGIDYNFISKEEFINRMNKNEFFEYVIYNSNYYGTLKKDITDEKVVILEPSGFMAYKNSHMKNIISFYLDTRDEIRKERMIKRGDNIIKINERLTGDHLVFNRKNIDGVSYILNSNDLTVEELAIEIDNLYKNKIEN